MSKITNRETLRHLSALQIDAHYAYQTGLQIFNSNIQNPDEYRELCNQFRSMTDDIVRSIELIRRLIPNE